MNVYICLTLIDASGVLSLLDLVEKIPEDEDRYIYGCIYTYILVCLDRYVCVGMYTCAYLYIYM